MKKIALFGLLLGAMLIVGCSPKDTVPVNPSSQEESQPSQQEEESQPVDEDEDEDVEWFPWAH